MTFNRVISLLGRNKISCNPKISVRILFLLQSSVWSSIFAGVEKIRFGKRFQTMQIPEDPVFIIGHWRTGTTLLFKLMSLDKQFSAPTLFQVAEPDSILTSHAYYKPVMKALVKKTRPMDNVRIGMDEPQEDEYAIFRLTGSSPLEKLVFPCKEKYFIQEWVENMLIDQPDELLIKHLGSFYSKVHYNKPGMILSKNPFHSFRIRSLLKAFPKARFIQIHRHPFCVIPSTINMWNILQKENALNNDFHGFDITETCRIMKAVNEKISNDTASLSGRSYAEIRFEELESNPVSTVRQLYSALRLEFSGQLAERISEFIESNSNFQKNRFTLSSNDKSVIVSELNDYMARHNYS